MGDLKALLAPAWVHTALGGVALLAVAWLVAWLVRHVLVRVMTTVSRRTAWHWDDALLKRGVFRRLAQVAPMLVLHRGIGWVPGVPVLVDTLVSTLTMVPSTVACWPAASVALAGVAGVVAQAPSSVIEAVARPASRKVRWRRIMGSIPCRTSGRCRRAWRLRRGM